MSKQLLDPRAYQRSLAVRDLTDAALGPHAMQRLLQSAVESLTQTWGCPAIVYRSPPVVTVAENYDDLRYPADGASREARYSRYITDELLLRTQTSASVPRALRMIAPAAHEDVLLVCPGLAYRRDSIDRLHIGEPHQLDLWRIRRGQLLRGDLERMIEIIAAAMLPGVPLRLDSAAHPYTLDGCEVHGWLDGAWVEILECGLAHPAILESAGLNTQQYSGLAMGIGLDRILMLRKGIKDIRLLRSSDPRIARQLIDLEPYRAVSMQPPINRDLSIAVRADVTAEELGDRIRSALGDASKSIEQIAIVAETGYGDLSDVARQRLGMSPSQKNVLVRIVIRDLDRTLTAAEGNRLRDEIYAAIHEGRVESWAAR